MGFSYTGRKMTVPQNNRLSYGEIYTRVRMGAFVNLTSRDQRSRSKLKSDPNLDSKAGSYSK